MAKTYVLKILYMSPYKKTTFLFYFCVLCDVTFYDYFLRGVGGCPKLINHFMKFIIQK